MELYKGKYWSVVFVDWCQEFVGDCVISSDKECLSELKEDEWIELGKIERRIRKSLQKSV